MDGGEKPWAMLCPLDTNRWFVLASLVIVAYEPRPVFPLFTKPTRAASPCMSCKLGFGHES